MTEATLFSVGTLRVLSVARVSLGRKLYDPTTGYCRLILATSIVYQAAAVELGST
jgi:hypothetical protein